MCCTVKRCRRPAFIGGRCGFHALAELGANRLRQAIRRSAARRRATGAGRRAATS